MPVPLWIAGSITIVALVGLGIFVYPRWLQRTRGRVLVALTTAALAALFHWFDGGRSTEAVLRVALALLWALAPMAPSSRGSARRAKHACRRPAYGMATF